jgi:hypothetical protein
VSGRAKDAADDGLPVEELCRPLPLFGLGLMALNDHFLRIRWPGLITGKISDFAVLLYLPALLTALLGLSMVAWNAVAPRLGGRPVDARLTRRRVLLAAFASGFALAALKLSPAARDLYVSALRAVDFLHVAPAYRLELDPTDLVALVVLPVAVLDGLAAVRRQERRMPA